MGKREEPAAQNSAEFLGFFDFTGDSSAHLRADHLVWNLEFYGLRGAASVELFIHLRVSLSPDLPAA